MKCRICGKVLSEGSDAISLEEGVIGQHGFVPLGAASVCCSSECVTKVFTAENGYYRRKRRVP